MVPLLVAAEAVVAHASCGSCRELVREHERLGERLPGLGEPVGQPHPQRLVTAHAATGEDQVERVAVADQPSAGARCLRRPTARPIVGSTRRTWRPGRRRAGRTTPPARGRRRRRSPRWRRSPVCRATPASGPSGRRPRDARRPGCRRPLPTALRSAPAQNVPPAPVSTATCCASSWSNSSERGGQCRGGVPVDGVADLRAVDRDDDHLTVVVRRVPSPKDPVPGATRAVTQPAASHPTHQSTPRRARHDVSGPRSPRRPCRPRSIRPPLRYTRMRIGNAGSKPQRCTTT